jgi:hypothetical protein
VGWPDARRLIVAYAGRRWSCELVEARHLGYNAMRLVFRLPDGTLRALELRGADAQFGQVRARLRGALGSGDCDLELWARRGSASLVLADAAQVLPYVEEAAAAAAAAE